jgi:hypothetical protein
MPVLTIDISHDAPTSNASTDPEQLVTAQLFGEPYPLQTVELSAGVGTLTLPVGDYWVHRFGESKLVHLGTDARLDELANLDPDTLDPTVEPEAAWDARADDLEERVTDLEAAGPGGGGPAEWGAITGTMADQTDLAAALAGKQPAGSYAASVHGHAISDVVGLAAALAGFAPTVHGHVIADVTGLQAALDAKAALSHTHTIANVTGLQAALDAKQPAGSYAAAVHTHPTSDVTGLDAALAAKAPLASPAFTGTPTGITKAHVGLGNVDNTADSAKPVSTAQQTALNLKADLASPTLTGDPKAPTPATADNDTSIATTAFVKAQGYAPLASPAFTGTPTGITKTHVGLANVDNTSDANKPVSTAQQTALDAKAPLASPTFTGTPAAPTATAGTNTTQIATTAFVQAATAALVDSAPGTLDTLNELAAALGDDPDFAATLASQIGALDGRIDTLEAAAPTAAHIYATDLGDGVETEFTVTHSLSTRDVTVQVRQAASPYAYVLADVEAVSTSAVTVRFAVAPTSGQYRVIVMG